MFTGGTSFGPMAISQPPTKITSSDGSSLLCLWMENHIFTKALFVLEAQGEKALPGRA